MTDWTVWCQDANASGTVWIGTVQARNSVEAETRGKRACATAWDWQGELDDIKVLGIARGPVEIVYWNED